MKKKKIIRFSIIMVIFLVIFGIVFLINSLNKKNINTNYQEPEPEVIPYEMEPVEEYSYFFSIVNILNNYLNYVHDKNNEALLQILHSEYLDLYKINDSNLYDNLGNFEDGLQLSFKAKIMDYKMYDNRYLYYVKGEIIENNFEDSKVVSNDVMFLVNVDYDNVTYAIYPLNYLYEILPINEPEKEISLNNYNELIGSNIITKEYICNLYLDDFIDKINNDEDTYHLLSDDFRKKQYPKKDDYLSFMANNKDKLNYQVYSCNSLSGTSHVYEVKDMNFNSYTFTEESIMNYKVEFTIN